MFREAAQRLGAAYHPDEEDWRRFKTYCAAKFPGVALVDKTIKIYEVAQICGLEHYYSSFYRLYCQFTHAALEAVVGSLDSVTDKQDNIVVALCVFSAIEAFVEIGATCENFESIKRDLLPRLTALRELSRSGPS
jgi:hypothetical protein